MRVYELQAGPLNFSNRSVPDTLCRILFGGFSARNIALRWRAKIFEGTVLALRQAQGERAFPFVVSYVSSENADHERLFLRHVLK